MYDGLALMFDGLSCRKLVVLLTTGIHGFAECFLSGTRQILALGNERVCREPDSRQRITLSKDIFAECQTLGEGGARQRAVSSRL
jgi:hypothetical protein